MRALIIEDEGIAADHLIGLIQQMDSEIEIVGKLDSVKSAVRWFQSNPSPDLAFFDIQLADGHSFEIFDKVSVNCPIIFTTAYDQYAIEAFKVNSVDYLLKPIKKDDLSRALLKFKSATRSAHPDISSLMTLMAQQNKQYKERFVIKIGDHLKSVSTVDVGVFYSYEKSTYLISKSGQKYLLDQTLDQLESLIDPRLFFRISRKYIIHVDAISDIISFSNSRLKLKLLYLKEEDTIVARERVSAFKEWLDR